MEKNMFISKELKVLGIAGVVGALALGPASYVLASHTPQFATALLSMRQPVWLVMGKTARGRSRGFRILPRKRALLANQTVNWFKTFCTVSKVRDPLWRCRPGAATRI